VLGNDATIGVAGSQGNFELNVYKPVMIDTLLQSIRLLADGAASFNDRCIEGLEVNKERVDELLHRSLMLVTALSPVIGYDNAAKVAKTAHKKGITLREAAIELELLSGEDFDKSVRPEEMTSPK
jgi:fumarate hydratase class II